MLVGATSDGFRAIVIVSQLFVAIKAAPSWGRAFSQHVVGRVVVRDVWWWLVAAHVVAKAILQIDTDVVQCRGS